MISKKPLKLFSVKLDGDRIKKARSLGVDIAKTLRYALDKKIFETAGKCPTCGRKMKEGIC